MLVAIVQGILMADIASEALPPNKLLIDSIAQGAFAAMAILAAVFHKVRWLQVSVPALFIIFALAFYGRMIEQ